jgi:hypothetical protein
MFTIHKRATINAMRKYLFAFTLTVLTTVAGQAQKLQLPADYNNPAVEQGQRVSTDIFIKLLEQGKVDAALKLIDTSFLKTKKHYQDSLTAFAKELSKYLKSTQLSVVIVYPENKYNTYRCRYYNKNGEFFYIDLYFAVGQPNSLIKKIWKKPESELAKERKELAKRAKEEEKTGPPQPPKLPPPGIEMTPVKKNK